MLALACYPESTGRKALAGTLFSSALAKSEKTFTIIVPLVLHAALMDQYDIPCSVPSEAEILEFAEWLMRVSGGCPTCVLDKADFKALGLLELAPEEIEPGNLGVPSLRLQAHPIITRMAAEKLQQMNIHPEEMKLMLSFWLEVGDDRCLSNTQLMDALTQIRRQRQALSFMQLTAKK